MIISLIKDNVYCTQVTVDESTLETILLTQSWCPTTFEGDYRLKKNLIQTDIIALDIDDGLSLPEAKKLFRDYKHIIATSRNHRKYKNGKNRDRFRVVLFLTEPITDNPTFKATWNALAEICPALDRACSDSSRFYYPCTSTASLNLKGKTIDVVEPRMEETPRIPCIASNEERGQLSIRSKRFLHGTWEPGTWHGEFIYVAKDLKGQLYTMDEAHDLLSNITGHLDDHDEYQLEYAYDNEDFEVDFKGLYERFVDGKKYKGCI